MIMHFVNFYQKYGSNHRYVASMINATLRAQLSANVTEAVTKLQIWSKTVKDDFVRGNVEGNSSTENNNILRRRTVPDELAKLNSEVTRMRTIHNDIQAQVTLCFQQGQHTETELSSVKTSLCHIMEQNEQLISQNRLILQQQSQL